VQPHEWIALRTLVGLVACFNFSIVDAWAQSYPVKPIRMLFGFSVGGAGDIAARLIAQKLSESLGLTDNFTNGIRMTSVVFTGNTATGGTGGAIYNNRSIGTGPVSNNSFVGNTATSGGGIYSDVTLNAINNWWGAASGPLGAGPGTGDAVSTDVTFAPFLTSAPSACSAGSPPPSQPIPTLSEWALWTMMLLLLAGGMWAMRRHVR
jgi:predicted outer membrane repeat protein